MEKFPLHIKNPELQTSPEVQRAVERQEQRTGESVPNEPDERIEAYLDRLECLILDPKEKQSKKDIGDILHTKRPRALSLLRKMVINEYVRPNKEKMAEAASLVEERFARQMGVTAEYGEEQLEQRGEIAVGDLESSLDQWIKYLSDTSEPYPTWFRYYAFKNILNLGEFDKDKQEFPKRSKGTFKLFPDVDRGALAYVQEMMEASRGPEVLNRIREKQKTLWDTPEKDLLTKEQAKAFANMSFAKQYADGIKQNGEISPELREETQGEWVHYKQGEDPKALWLSLQNKGTAWCTKGYPTAKTQLEGGDFYVYYTFDTTGKPTIPRIAIRMEGDKKISNDVRGVFDTQQNLEPNMVPILEEKLKDFGPEADRFKKKSEDMKKLTAIEFKHKKSESFTKDDLLLLYEINSQIEGFGYQKDPRIAELRKGRDLEEDMLVIFDCTKEEIAHVPSEINEKTKAYVGQLEPGIFQKLPDNLGYVYTSFPEKKIRRENVEVGGKTAEQLIAEMEGAKIKLSEDAKLILENKKEFIITKKQEEVALVSLTVADLGFKSSATTDQIYARAQELGLELCPADTGPHYRLKYKDQPLNEWIRVAMKQIADSVGNPIVFDLDHDDDGLWLIGNSAKPGLMWHPNFKFVFRLRKSEP